MKLRNLIVIGLLFFICLLPVKAEDTEELFKLNWSTDVKVDNRYRDMEDYFSFQNGYNN